MAPASQVAQQCNLPEGTGVEFTEVLFQPVPYSPGTKKGMPAQFERYQEDPGYTIINVRRPAGHDQLICVPTPRVRDSRYVLLMWTLGITSLAGGDLPATAWLLLCQHGSP